MNNKIEPVDVLAVFEEIATKKNPFGDVVVAAAMYEATFRALAELFEAVRDGVETRTHNGFVIHYNEVQAERLATSIVRVVGAA